ncbi:dihydrodipicolinate synthase family protein [Bradyrhizobium sp. 141]|uniref:dihydrodipicolinate synthase family protein n=1 Tax=Bradyrhizobium sp. 141 TaxID=2782617 RepID=UPI001FFA3885|nr:dihydrodipicolinate synthase family protein [Bradyrhizobium sp. 141]MCK1716909.1 dihydrodipicolinate synthase family protein [Bradyrhizobium sp. 141]
MKLEVSAKGVYPIAPTPFHEDGRIDFNSIDRLSDFYLESGATGMTVLGVLGEAPKLDAKEALDVASRFIKRAPKLPVIVGVSAAGFASMRTLSSAAMDAGAAGVMIAPPSTLRTDDQIVTYYAQAAEAIGSETPFCIQDYPLNYSVVMAPGVLKRIITDNPSCVMVKHEDWPGLEKISTLRKWEAEGSLRHVSILCGNNGLFLDFETERGADGAMTGYPFADMLVELVRLAQSGQRDAAHDLFDLHLPLLRYEQQPGVGLSARKYILARRGLISSPAQRKPAGAFTAAARSEVDYLLSRIARVDQRAACKPLAA